MMINNIIILGVMACVLIEYFKNKHFNALLIIGVAYICLPVIKISEAIGINSAYAITLTSFIIFLHSLLKKRLIYDKKALFYLFFMFMALFVMGAGWGINGRFTLSGLLSFVGMAQFIVATFMLAVLTKTYCVDKDVLMRKILILAVAINCFIGFFQIVFFSVGEKLTRQLYTHVRNEILLDYIKEARLFSRLFGTFHSPTILGVFSLLSLTFFLSQMINKREVRKSTLLCFVISLGLGLLAFSKLVIIGVLLMLVLSFLVILIHYRCRGALFVFLKIFASTIVTFLIISSFQRTTVSPSFVNRFYSFPVNIMVVLESRYGNLLNIDENNMIESPIDENNMIESPIDENNMIESPIDENNMIESPIDENNMIESPIDESKTGNQRDVFSVFLEHPLVGVGPTQVNDEFIGDSLYITTLHNGGIFAFLIYGVFYGALMIRSFLKKKNQELFILFAIGMGGVSAEVFSCSCAVPFLAYCICEANQNEHSFRKGESHEEKKPMGDKET